MAASDLVVGRGALHRSALLRVLEEECFVVLVLAGALAAVARLGPSLVVQDTWLALVDGRWIAAHGLPHVDGMTVWTKGTQWVDQQWLAHLVLYGVAALGGLRAVLAVGIALAFAAFGLAAAVARSAGASARSTALVVPIAVFGMPWLLQVRTQSFALPLFVGVYALLAADARRPSRRVYAVLPLLVLWGNLHGSAALGAALVVVHAVLSARRRPWCAALLALGAPLTLLASPYGLQLVGYYHGMLLGSPLGTYIDEWKPATPSAVTAVFFATAFATVFLLGRHPRALSPFERAALPLLVVAGLLAVRNGVWLGLASAVSLPLLVEAERPTAIVLTAPLRRLNTGLSVTGLALAATVAVATFARPESWFERGWPTDGARAVAAAAGSDGLVLADDRHSDWLLWREPQLQGRLAFDVRFELLPARRLAALRAFRRGTGAHALADGYRILTFGSTQPPPAFAGSGVVYRGPGLSAIVRP